MQIFTHHTTRSLKLSVRGSCDGTAIDMNFNKVQFITFWQSENHRFSVVRNETPNSSEMALWIYDMDSSKTLLADHRPHLFCSLAHLSVAPWRKVGGLLWAPKWPVSRELSIGVAEEKVGEKGGWGTLMWCRLRKCYDSLDWVLWRLLWFLSLEWCLHLCCCMHVSFLCIPDICQFWYTALVVVINIIYVLLKSNAGALSRAVVLGTKMCFVTNYHGTDSKVQIGCIAHTKHIESISKDFDKYN